MKNTLLITLFVALLSVACVHRSAKCVKAHKNIKKLHLQNW
jgi:hypothetical protein